MPAPALTKLLKLLSKRRTKSMLKAHAEFQKIDILDLCTQLRTLLSTLEQQAKTTGFTKLPTEFRQRPTGITLNKLRRDLASEITKSLQGQRQMNIHRVRIKAKRLRYLLEVVEELGYPDVDLHLMWLRRLQHYLGSWHDLEVQEKIVLKMLSRRTIAKDSAQFEPLTGMVRKMRVVKYDIEEAYLKQVREGDELERLQLWIKSHFEDTT